MSANDELPTNRQCRRRRRRRGCCPSGTTTPFRRKRFDAFVRVVLPLVVLTAVTTAILFQSAASFQSSTLLAVQLNLPTVERTVNRDVGRFVTSVAVNNVATENSKRVDIIGSKSVSLTDDDIKSFIVNVANETSSSNSSSTTMKTTVDDQRNNEGRPLERLSETFKWQSAVNDLRTTFLFSAHYDPRKSPALIVVIGLSDDYESQTRGVTRLRLCRVWFTGGDQRLPVFVASHFDVLAEHNHRR